MAGQKLDLFYGCHAQADAALAGEDMNLVQLESEFLLHLSSPASC